MDYRQPDLSVITVNYNGFHDTWNSLTRRAATVFSVSYEIISLTGSTADEAAFATKNISFLQSKPYAVSGIKDSPEVTIWV